jgi:hypothetical protein
MQVRLAFSVAIHANKEILLMDEVLAVGDSNFQSKCLTEFINFKHQNKTIILVTHDLGVAQKYCDRLMLLRSGKDIMTGNSHDVSAAYITQNMSDEEVRIYKKAQRKVDEEIEIGSLNIDPLFIENTPGVKVAKIEKIEFLDESLNLKTIFKTGDELYVRIWFSKQPEVTYLNFGVAIYSQEDYYIFGVNTLLDKFNTQEFLEKGYCDVHYPKLNLGTNKYYVRAGIYEDQVEKLIDFVDQSKEYFQVQAFNLNTGIVHLDYEWI